MASLEAARAQGVAKASWMLRRSDILCRWKHCFCVLFRNGRLTYYKDETRKEEQGTVKITISCYLINVGAEVKDASPPPGKDISCLLELRTHEANLLFCTDSVDDSQAWKAAIVEVKNSTAHPAQPPAVAPPQALAPPPVMAPPPYTPQPAPVVAVAPPPYTVTQVATPANHVVVNPVGGATTYTTYQVPANQYVIPPANQTVIVNGRRVVRSYPVQSTVYAYPGQTCMYTCQPSQTTVVYRR
ncbi:pleckstrin homology domain-containing family B member 2-like [Acanthaster planci]|uniref:Pleckstrin homology domain-containing family B member 2-like n=1 Tax=Acanthaster planci TaxID=133434 RepID=A0A8B7Y8U8_ACAPL|nr:pleckstrin homology domain-containing family B member 2-like [Acanthaster planci]XP_022088167.1 pleckstrin homology domain-containing family B member 2-like [Acanthaster planci]